MRSPGFQKVLQAINNTETDVLLVYMIDRIGRFASRKDRNLVIEALEDNQVNVDSPYHGLFRWNNEKELNNQNYTADVIIRSPYNTWHYWNGVLNIAMLELAEYFGDDVYKKQAVKNYEFVFKNVGLFKEKYTEDKNKWVYQTLPNHSKNSQVYTIYILKT